MTQKQGEMTTEDVLDIFRQAGALLEGHFILSSGRRSALFMQKALIFQNPVLTAKLCAALADKVRDQLGVLPDVIIAPAMGGVIPGYEMARQLGLNSMFMEREGGEFTLRRGFALDAGQTVLMVEDIVTTGLSSRETITAITNAGGNVVAGCCIFDRSGGDADIGVPLISLASKRFPDFDPNDLPAELVGIEAIKPGSRGLT